MIVAMLLAISVPTQPNWRCLQHLSDDEHAMGFSDMPADYMRTGEFLIEKMNPLLPGRDYNFKWRVVSESRTAITSIMTLDDAINGDRPHGVSQIFIINKSSGEFTQSTISAPDDEKSEARHGHCIPF